MVVKRTVRNKLLLKIMVRGEIFFSTDKFGIQKKPIKVA